MTPRQGATFIRLDLDSQDARPKDDYFELALEHKNYNSLYSLVLAGGQSLADHRCGHRRNHIQSRGTGGLYQCRLGRRPVRLTSEGT